MSETGGLELELGAFDCGSWDSIRDVHEKAIFLKSDA